MDFTEVLNPRTIITHLKVNQKAEALEAMAELFAEAGIIGDKEQYIKDVYVREEMGATGIGGYIAIPHGKSKAVITPGAAIAVLDHEIEWESLDGAGAKVIILFAVGADHEAAEEHLRLLTMFSKRLGDRAVVSRLIDADTAEEVMLAFTDDGCIRKEEPDEEEELNLDEISIM